MLTFRPRLLATSSPPPTITRRPPRVSKPPPAPVDGVVSASTAPVGVGELVDPSTPSVGLGVGVESPVQPRIRTNPDARVAWVRDSLPFHGAQRSSW
jgi:hypothetical protein